MRGNQLVRIRYGCSEPPHPHTPQRLCRNPPQAGRQQSAVPLTRRRFPVRRGTGSTPSVLQAADGVGCRWLARRPACAAPRILTHTLPSNSPLVATAPLLCRWPLAHDETDDGDDDEYDKQHISDGGCCTRYSRNPQEGRNQPNDEKYYGPMQHDRISLDRNWAEEIGGDFDETARLDSPCISHATTALTSLRRG